MNNNQDLVLARGR